MICLDTMVLIWGIQRHARAGQERKIDLASRYLMSLDAKEIVMVPSVVLSEYLVGVEKSSRKEHSSLIARRFFVPAFDAEVASLAADIVGSRAAFSGERRTLKADAQIIATAITYGADKIVTGNYEEFKRIAGDRIDVVDIPVVIVQPALDFSSGTQPN